MNFKNNIISELFQLAKQYSWDPQKLDLDRDACDWSSLAPREQDVVLNLLSMFIKGEEDVASELAPLLYALGKVGGLREEEMFVASQLFDESLHVEFFHRWFDEIVREPVDHSRYWGASYRVIFDEALPGALEALMHDQSPRAQVCAIIPYHMIVEGILAETGYHAIFLACERRQVLSGLRQGIELIKRDESRHIAYGIYALQRLVLGDPALLELVHAELNRLLPSALGIIPEALAPYGDEIPFGIDLQEMTEYAIDQFNKRLSAIESAVARAG